MSKGMGSVRVLHSSLNKMLAWFNYWNVRNRGKDKILRKGDDSKAVMNKKSRYLNP